MFTCDICGEEGLSEPEMKTHLVIAHVDNELSCPFCSLAGVTYDELNFHINTAHVEVHGEHSKTSEDSGQFNLKCGESSKLKDNDLRNSKRKDSTNNCEMVISSTSRKPSTEQQSSVAVKNGSQNLGNMSASQNKQQPSCLSGSQMVESHPGRQNTSATHCDAFKKKTQACAAEVLYSTPECPFCGQMGTSGEDVEEHLKRKHADLLGTPTKGGMTEKFYECPMCGLICANCHILQEHIELHLQENSFEEGQSRLDLEVAKRLQEEEGRYRRSEESRREKEEFQKLQKQYGLDKSGGYKQQSLQNLHRAVAKGQMPPVEFHRRKAEIMESIALGADDGRTKTSGILRALHELYQRDGRNIGHVWLSSETDHFHASLGDKGWGCGYRNFQMLLSSLLQLDLYKDGLKDCMAIPCIPKIQSMIEGAWKEGFDPQGAAHFGGKLQNTRAWIGASDIHSLLTSLGLKCRIVDFHRPTGPSDTHPRLFEWVKNYYSSGSGGTRLPPRVLWTNKPPIYLQHQGHSRTIIGIEERTDGTLCLLIFDPGCPSQEMKKLLNRDASGSNFKLVRRFIGSLKHKQYQIVAVEGILSLEEKNARKQASRILTAEKIP